MAYILSALVGIGLLVIAHRKLSALQPVRVRADRK